MSYLCELTLPLVDSTSAARGWDEAKKISEAPYVVDERLVTPNISVIRTSLKDHFWSKAGFGVCVFCALQHIIMP